MTLQRQRVSSGPSALWLWSEIFWFLLVIYARHFCFELRSVSSFLSARETKLGFLWCLCVGYWLALRRSRWWRCHDEHVLLWWLWVTAVWAELFALWVWRALLARLSGLKGVVCSSSYCWVSPAVILSHGSFAGFALCGCMMSRNKATEMVFIHQETSAH